MRTIATVLILGSVLVAAPELARLDAWLAALVAITVVIAAAGAASGGWSPLAVGLGALGALAATALAPVSPALGGAALVALALGTRAVRAPTLRWAGAHVAVALATGSTAALVAAHFAGAPLGVRAASLLVAGLLAAVALILPTDDAMAHTLALAGRLLPAASGAPLARAAALRRRSEGALQGLSPSALARLERAWSALGDAARARLDARGAAADVLDRRIQSHGEALERIYAAADERLARAVTLDDQRLVAAKIEGERLEAEVAALVEVGVAPSTQQDIASDAVAAATPQDSPVAVDASS